MEQLSFNELIGLPLSCISRCVNMVCIFFGQDIIKEFPNGKIKVFSEYAIHIQCGFRMMLDEKILLASMDIYEPVYEVSENFDWDVKGNNMFDKKTESVLKIVKNSKVKEVRLNPIGDLTLVLDNNIIIEVIVISSLNEENWRFLSSSTSKPHLVMIGNKLE